jgi:hypothetical protein
MGDEPMLPLLPTVLLTPMIMAPEPVTPMSLAAEPVRLEIPEQTYDHRTQTSTFKGNADKRFKLAYTWTQTQQPCRRPFDNGSALCMDSDSDQ